MSSTTKKGRKELVIEHITYDATHQPMNPYTPASTSAEMGSRISSSRRSQLRNSSEQVSSRAPKSLAERQVTQWPSADLRVATADLATFVLQKEREERAVRKRGKIAAKANSSGRYLSLPDEKSSTATKVTPGLRRKEKFSEVVMAELNCLSQEDEEHPLVAHDANMQRFEEIRRAIKEGKMERVVPPRTEAEKERLAPHRHSVTRPSSSRSAPATDTKPKAKAPKDRKPADHRKNRSSGSKLAAYLEKGKEIQSKFPSPFSHLNYPSFSLSRKASVSSSTSSFYCIGEDEEEQRSNNDAIKALKTRQNENRKRLSGDGTSPWAQPSNDKCRLCRKAGTQGVRGLCSECEKDLLRPKTTVGLGISFPDSEEEIKPTPPLKDQKTLSIRKSNDRNYLLHVPDDDDDEWEDERPITPIKDDIRLARVDAGSKPSISSVSPRIFSQRAEIEEEEDSDAETVKRWNSGPFAPVPKESKNLFEKWSAVYQNGDYRQFQAEDRTPLIPTAQKRSPGMQKLSPNAHQKSARDSSFYDFWGELLEDGKSDSSKSTIKSLRTRK
ncbi:uncharacterized protein PAC_07888 [Phialocephala subalpina]|uniref:Uncharacterized protein n=1 Tax=Phialocephala subalpina TaxID=576137 RepID=A0A1L7WYZ9_9HELO|nr:uncharacterized protein PAC_07888 [Phialocephala subalpina]